MNTEIINLAKEIQSSFKNFYLAGGTAIMIKYNHRESFDLDFFSQKEFSYNLLTKKVLSMYNTDINRWEKKDDNIDFFIKDIKVSFVLFPFPNLEKIEKFDTIKIAGDFDLFLNKVYVAGSRIDPKDPFDAAFLCKKHNWDKSHIAQSFETKFKEQSFKIYLGALLSFEDYQNIPDWVKETLSRLM